MKVLHIGLTQNYGGIESYVYNVFQYANNKDIHFDFLSYKNEKIAYEDYFLSYNCKIYRIDKRSKKPLIHFFQIVKILKKERYDYIHCHFLNCNWFEPVLACSLFKKTKIIVHSHTSGFCGKSSFKEKTLNFIGKTIISGIDYYRIACSEKAGNWMFGNKNFKIIKNGIDFNKYSFNEDNRKNIRKELNLNDNDIVIGNVGNFSYPKNYPLLLEVFKFLCSINNNYKLVLIGDDSLAQKEKKFVKNNNLAKNVIFTGIINNVNEYYSAMDVYFCFSHYEGLNISLIEAQCAGLQCFVSNKIDIENNANGYYKIININSNPNEIAKQIIQKTNQSIDRGIVINEKYSISNTAKEIIDLYINYNIIE